MLTLRSRSGVLAAETSTRWRADPAAAVGILIREIRDGNHRQRRNVGARPRRAGLSAETADASAVGRVINRQRERGAGGKNGRELPLGIRATPNLEALVVDQVIRVLGQ